jgi:hypothetical protein
MGCDFPITNYRRFQDLALRVAYSARLAFRMGNRNGFHDTCVSFLSLIRQFKNIEGLHDPLHGF